MLFYNHFHDSNILLFTYMFIYNTSLVTLFWTLFSIITTKFKTLHSFSGFSFNAFYLTLITILLFSMAGVPPFIGFFSKLFILTLITNNSFTLLYTIFFVVLFIGLYFYIQNIRFLHSTNNGELNYTYVSSNERIVPAFYYSTILVLTLVIFGAVYVEDALLLFTWILL
jgi:NADH:ubiquinone oxidoreductase subunit 2 (subunit N)